MQPVPEIIGSWNNTGFHGHHRAKARSDVMDLYRQLAKPQPPDVFNRRFKEATTNYPFTHHDNRELIRHEAEGIGKKRVKSKNRDGQADLLTWMPMKEELEKSGPLLSTYGHQFRGDPVEVDGLRQKLVTRMRLTVDRPGLTTYRTSHGHDNPHRRDPSPVLKNRLLKAEPNKATVATCLNWYRPPRPLPFIANPRSSPSSCNTQLVPIAPPQCRRSDENDVQIPGCNRIQLPVCRPVAEKTSCHLASRKEFVADEEEEGRRRREDGGAAAARQAAEEEAEEKRRERGQMMDDFCSSASQQCGGGGGGGGGVC